MITTIVGTFFFAKKIKKVEVDKTTKNKKEEDSKSLQRIDFFALKSTKNSSNFFQW